MKKEIRYLNNLPVTITETDGGTSIKSIDSIVSRTTKIPNEDTFNNKDKYIINFKNTDILNQFPEYLASYVPFATNTGLLCFCKKITDENNNSTNILVVYDLLAKGGDNLADILPDINPMLSYDHIKTPMNVRQLNFENGKFIAAHKYTYYNNEGIEITCCLYNCDKINDIEANDNGYFENVSDTVSEVKFEYKPLFVIRAFKSSGEQYNDSVDKNNNNEINDNIYNTTNLIKKENGIYYADISNQSSASYFTLTAPSGSGYLEVL